MRFLCRTTPALAAILWVAEPAFADDLEYNRDIRPILAENCFACHGPDSAARKADLRLDRRDDAVTATAIVPGDPAKSGVVDRIFTSSAKQLMPPAKSNKNLTAAQKDILKRWIAQGAKYQSHWSLIAPSRPALPLPAGVDWARNPIDNFILAKLNAAGLKPAPEADRRTLARRASFDVTGLPPDPADVEAFANDQAPRAYERYLDKLFESPHWGEHRGRYWLDAARYADTHGIHFDNYREIWTYRDWVIDAFNRNVPFDRFTVEQLAGDLLPQRTVEQQVATGFNRCNITTNEGGAISEEYLVLYARDRTETVAQVWMASTAGCAVCHDHKFDPLSTRDFYSLSAFFNNTTQNAMDGNIKDTPPIIVVPTIEDRRKFTELSAKLAELRAKADERRKAARGEFTKWLGSAQATEVAKAAPVEGLVLSAPLSEGDGKKLSLTVDGKDRSVTLDSGFAWAAGGRTGSKAFALQPGKSIELPDVGDFEKDRGFAASAWVKLARRGNTGALVARMDNGAAYRGWDVWIENDRVGMHIIDAWPDNALKVLGRTALQPNKWYHIAVSYDGSSKASGVRVFLDGAPQAVDVAADKLSGSIRTKVPFKVGQRSATERLNAGFALQDLRVFSKALTGPEVERLAKGARAAELLAKAADKRTPKENDELFDWWLASFDAGYGALNSEIGKVAQEETAVRSRGTIAHVMQEKPGEAMAYVLFRGDYDKRRDPVKADTPKALPPMPADLPRNRLGLAQWLLRPEHPLTARVTVNRFWQEVFGTGLVLTAGDFGVTGDLPSHPELLDWMAVEFREGGWDIKKFYKMMLTSATYRQSAAATPDKLDKDAQNRLLSRGPRFRMDAEMIRDTALAASGTLVSRIGGPSVRPYQPEGVWEAVAMIGSNTRDYRPDKGDGLYRRSMYTFWKRAAPPASMDIFNAPNRETVCVRRERTNTPLQALVTLNDPQFIEAARNLGQIAMRAGDANAGIDTVARRLLSRPLRDVELAVVRRVFDELLAHYKAAPDEARKLIAVGESKPDAALDAPTLAAWTMTVNQLMNLDEALNK